MQTIAQGEVAYTFDASLLPAVPFSGDGSLVFPRPRQVTLAPYSNPLSNTFAKPDTELLAKGGPIHSIVINRDGSVIASNKAGRFRLLPKSVLNWFRSIRPPRLSVVWKLQNRKKNLARKQRAGLPLHP